MRQVFFDVLLGNEPLITGLLYEKQAEPAIKEWLKSNGKAGLTLTPNPDEWGGNLKATYSTSEHYFLVVER